MDTINIFFANDELRGSDKLNGVPKVTCQEEPGLQSLLFSCYTGLRARLKDPNTEPEF